ncbi:MAG: hypothetical protein RL722_2230, partial [Pseudomonadota bacterium]
MSPRARRLERASPWLLLAATLLLWQLLCSGLGVSEFIVPSPAAIARALAEQSGLVAAHAWRTFWVTMAGFALSIVVGVLLGFLIGSSRLAYTAVYPLMTAF